jgi:quercetin dioxygenase-like cupin family protein
MGKIGLPSVLKHRKESDMTGDAVTVAPHFYKVVLENDRVRVLEVRGRPGDKTELHSHPAQVAIALSDGTFRFTSPDGQPMEAELKAGQAMYLPPVEHTSEITGTTEAHALLVELK